MSMLLAVAMCLAAVVVYFIPYIVAMRRFSDAYVGILLLNLFFGWTVVGWFAALIWAYSSKATPPAPAKADPLAAMSRPPAGPEPTEEY
jgi:hypothetical protein